MKYSTRAMVALATLSYLLLSVRFQVCAANDVSMDIEKYSLDQLNQKMKEEPNNPVLWDKKGRVLASAFEDEAALQAFSKAIDLKPDFARAYYDRGSCYKNQLRYVLAKQDLVKTISLLKTSPANTRLLTDARGQLAGVYDLEKNYSAELKLLQQNAKVIHNGVDYTRVANCEIKLGKLADAEIDYKQALKLSPNDSEIMASYAALLARKGEHELAAKQYTMAIETTTKSGRSFLIRKHFEFYEKRANCYRKLGNEVLFEHDMRIFKGYADGAYDASPFRLK